jgi:DNA repair protein RecN (Recombination protein N)
LCRKHGGTTGDVLAAQVRLRSELSDIEHAAEKIDALQADIDKLTARGAKLAQDLRNKRTTSAPTLSTSLVAELPPLGMPSARMELVVEPMVGGPFVMDGFAYGPSGGDNIEIRFSANAGEPLAGLGKVASGGELSRVLLALKRTMLAKDPVPVSVFDEVDAGVGGAVGEAVGEKLQTIGAVSGEARQVLCITHLGSIAARADRHLHVVKREEQGRTVAHIRHLNADERVGEVARMIGGREMTEATLQMARDLLRAAQRSIDVDAQPSPAKRTKRKAGAPNDAALT